MKQIYLASASPRRKDLLFSLLGDRFTVLRHRHIEEDVRTDKLSPKELVIHHAVQKALSGAKNIKNGIVIGSDTVVVLGKKILGKPGSRKNAVNMLRLIHGKTVDVV